MAILNSRYVVSVGNRYYTDTTYYWYDDNSVEIEVVSGDDDWDNYNGVDNRNVTYTRFNKLPKEIRRQLFLEQKKNK